jgi:hypothetical protein
MVYPFIVGSIKNLHPSGNLASGGIGWAFSATDIWQHIFDVETKCLR